MRDVVFLFNLHRNVNEKVMDDLEKFRLRYMLLATQLEGLLKDRALNEDMMLAVSQISMELPYPLDPETADAVEAARKHHVITWEELEEHIQEWVLQSFIDEGKFCHRVIVV